MPSHRRPDGKPAARQAPRPGQETPGVEERRQTTKGKRLSTMMLILCHYTVYYYYFFLQLLDAPHAEQITVHKT